MKIQLHCRNCDYWWEIASFNDLGKNTKCPKCKSTRVYGDEK